jgi:cyanophycinase
MTIKPLYLLADSQLLFWEENDCYFTSRMLEDMQPNMLGAAYIGASNRDDPQFYELFCAVMERMGLNQCRMIPARPSGDDLKFLEEAGLVLLSGGNAENGWRTIEKNGVKEIILRKRYDGSVLVGVSAGAIQLGLGALSESPQPQKLEMFRFAPFYLGAHEEHDGWWNLRALVHLSQTDVRGVGIPAGAGAVYHSDGTLEPIRKACVEFCKEDGRLSENVLLPVSPRPKCGPES